MFQNMSCLSSTCPRVAGLEDGLHRVGAAALEQHRAPLLLTHSTHSQQLAPDIPHRLEEEGGGGGGGG